MRSNGSGLGVAGNATPSNSASVPAYAATYAGYLDLAADELDRRSP